MTASSSAATVICAVAGIASAMIEVTGRPLWNERPRSPRTTWPSWSRYCTTSGRSSPYSWRSAATCSGVTELSVPTSSCTGSLGSAYMTRNDTVNAAHSTNSAWRTRRSA